MGATSTTKILYIEDEKHLHLAVSLIFRKEKWQLLIAENGEAGLEILKNTPDLSLILLDLKMPTMSGDEFLRRKNEVAGSRSVPVVVLSGSMEVADIACGFEVAHFLPKTAEPEELISVIKKVLCEEPRVP